MPMLHGCGFPGCTTLTLSTYCVEHELLVRASKESERSHASAPLALEDEPILRTTSEDDVRQPAPF